MRLNMELSKKDFTNVITKIQKGSIAEELEIQKGDILISINSQKVEDIIEYQYLIAEDYIELEIQTKSGEIVIYEIDKDVDEELGIEFENPITNSVQTCRNKCMFCFIDQLPKGMRKTLYIKDDDSRLSFLQGNFITMTNMGQKELDKMIKYHISPVNISVHTTDSNLRVKMLKNKTAGNILEKMTILKNANIDMNAQIVLIPNVNDKENLEKTLNDLEKLHPNLQSIAIVPIGITKYRDNLEKVDIFDKKSSIELIKQIEKFQKNYLQKLKTRFVFLSDEFYVMSGIKRPTHKEYEGYKQLENGVGLMTKQEFEYNKELKKIKTYDKKRTISIATGTSAYDFIKELSNNIANQFQTVTISVYKIRNDFFGETITVAGLVTATDMLNQLAGKNLGDELLIPKVMLKSDEDIFLDSITLKDFEQKLGTKVRVVDVDGYSFVKNVLDI
jgi:PDZ domain protein